MHALHHDDLARVLLQVLAILGVARLLAPVARWLGQPRVVAEIVAGILLGPSLLGWVAPSAFAWLFPVASLAGLKLLSQLGLVFFMFLVGLELDLRQLRGRLHTPLVVGFASIVVPLVLGIASAPRLHARYGEGIPFTPFAMFLGTAFSVTAFPVLARILSERHLIGTRVGAIAIASAAVDDVAAWCLMTLLVAVTRSDDWLSGLRVTALALGLVLLMIPILGPVLDRTVRRIESRGVSTATGAAVLFPLLLVAAVSELLGVHALFGAFLFGAVLPKDGPLADVVIDKLEVLTTSLLLPLFFAYSGLRTELSLVDERLDWLAIAGVIVIATAGKLGGGALAGRLTGLTWRKATAVGILLNVRGLMGLIVLNVGLDLGVVSPTLFTIMVLMALATTLLASPLLRLVYPDRETIAARLAALEPSSTPASDRPRQGRDTIVACVSDPRSGAALGALAHALALDGPAPTRVFGLHLAEPSDRVPSELRHDVTDPAALTGFLDRARALGVDARGLAFVSTSPADDIVRIADAKRASMILLGAHAPWWLGGRLDGSVREVVRSARRTVGVLVGAADRSVPVEGFTRILVAHAGPEDAPALAAATRLARRPGAQVVVVSVQTSALASPPLEPRAGWTIRTVRGADPREALFVAIEEEKPDLVVLALAERWRLSGDRLGRSRASLFERVNAPLLVVHHASAAAEAADEKEVSS